MISLEDRNTLVSIIQSNKLFETYRGRRQLLNLAELSMIAHQIDLEGPPMIVANELVSLLENYGRVDQHHHALGLFLNVLKTFIGDTSTTKKFIEDILVRYSLMSARLSTRMKNEWKGSDNIEELHEKIIGENTLRSISFLKKAISCSKSVAQIITPDWTGTGFLISTDLLITNHHVLPDEDLTSQSIYRFNYELDAKDKIEKVDDYRSVRDGLFFTSVEHDLTILEVKGAPGNQWSYINISTDALKLGQRVNIIQHPLGLPKQVSLQSNYVQYLDKDIIQYTTSTLVGSSGSPILDDHWRLVGLHHAGGYLTEPTSKKQYFRNEGISIEKILEIMPESISQKIA